MLMEKNSFKNFFTQKFFCEDRQYVRIKMPSLVSEMARETTGKASSYRDVSKKPTNIDEDDIEFLQQFPPMFWKQALLQRYNDDLIGALEGQHGQRSGRREELKSRLRNAISNQDWSLVRGLLPQDTISQLAREYDREWLARHADERDEAIEQAADLESQYEVEKAVPHVSEPQEEGLPPGYKRYTFRPSNRSQKSVTIIAKPFINRLVHKLGTRAGQEHHPESGLRELGLTHGRYGHDLSEPKRGAEDLPHTTRGMQLPQDKALLGRLNDFLALNQHRMFGDLPEDSPWRPIRSQTGDYQDKFLRDRYWEPAYHKWFSILQKAQPGEYELDGVRIPPPARDTGSVNGWENTSDIIKAARKMATKEIVAKAQRGEIKGPRIPGHPEHPEGKPLEVEPTKGGLGVKIKTGPIYLPHQKRKIKVEEDGRIVEKDVDVPVVKPAHYFRVLGTKDEDFARNDDGSVKIDPDTGEPVLAVPPEKLRGHDKRFVHVEPEEYIKRKGWYARGALHHTQNTGGRMYLDESDPEYEEARDAVFGNWQEPGWQPDADTKPMNLVGLNRYYQPTKDGEGKFYDDIIAGIWQCIRGDCGGGTNFEKEILAQSVEELHQAIYQTMRNNLRDERLRSPAKRRAFARNETSKFVQQNLKGGGTRRRRILTGGKGQSLSGDDETGRAKLDIISAKMRNRETLYQQRRRGEKRLPTGNFEFTYTIDNLRAFIDEMMRDAREADAAKEMLMRKSRSEVAADITALLQKEIGEKAEVIGQIRQVLKDLHKNAGATETEAEEIVHSKMTEFSAGGADVKEIVRRFSADPLIQQYLTQEPEAGAGAAEPKAELSPDEMLAIDKLKEFLDHAENAGQDLNDPQVKQRLLSQSDQIAQFIGQNFNERIRPRIIELVKQELNKRLGGQPAAPQPNVEGRPKLVRPTTTPQPAAQPAARAARAVQRPGLPDWKQLMAEKRYLELAHHPVFLRDVASIKTLTNLQNWLNRNRASLDQDDFEMAMDQITHAMSMKAQRELGTDF